MGVVNIFGGNAVYIELDAVFGNEGCSKSFDYGFVLEDELIASPVHVTGKVFNKTGIVRFTANAVYTLSTVCARCNAPIRREINVEIEHGLIVHAENDDNDYYIVVENMRLDIDALVSEDIYLAMPSRFLCNETCKGLCSICGADLNVTVCGCRKPTDPRWDALKNLV
jgi:uncharacterized protein